MGFSTVCSILLRLDKEPFYYFIVGMASVEMIKVEMVNVEMVSVEMLIVEMVSVEIINLEMVSMAMVIVEISVWRWSVWRCQCADRQCGHGTLNTNMISNLHIFPVSYECKRKCLNVLLMRYP